MAGQQQEEIETIRSRTIEVKLSDADVKRISEKAAAHGLTVGELIENFIGDLVCGTYSNGFLIVRRSISSRARQAAGAALDCISHPSAARYPLKAV